MFLFLFGLLFFVEILKYTNSKVYHSYYTDDYVADQCVSRNQILNTSIDADYDICAVFIFFVNGTINIHDLKKQIHVGLKLLPSYFNIIISARINTAQPDSGGFFIVYFR
jgi:hypothetical protein